MTSAAAVTFLLLSTLPFGTQQIEGKFTAAAARKLAAGKECRRPSKSPTPDKFVEIDRNLLAGSCWALEQMGRAKAAQRAPELEQLRREEAIPAELLPSHTEGDKLAVTLRKDEIRIEALTRESGFATGRQVTLQPIAAGDFSGTGASELLVWRRYSALGATFEECEVALIAKKGKKYSLVRRKTLGRCG